MIEALQLLNRAPEAVRLVALAKKAADGDPAALGYFKSQGWHEALELVRPGSGQTAQGVLDQVRGAVAGIQGTLSGDVLEGQFTVLDGPSREPWAGFMTRLFRQRYGGHIILGPPGQGKTSLAKKLAWRWHQQHGYQVECVSMYGDDVPDFAVTIGSKTLVRRIKMLALHLDSLEYRDEDDYGPDEAADDLLDAEIVPAKLPPTRKVIIIDETSLSMTVSPKDPRRNAALAALANCRHLDWIVLFIGQWASMLPPGLFGVTTAWVKRPAGKELHSDRDNPVVRDVWLNAMQAFEGLTDSPWYQPPYQNPKAWAYVQAPESDQGPGYEGLAPFTPVGWDEEE